MQKLHLVGFTTDHTSLILSSRRGARSGGFVLEIDEAVVAAVEAALAKTPSGSEPGEELDEPAEVPTRPQSSLSVRDLQARLRSGRTVESVAAEAGVDVEWVSRFAVPVFAEQARVIEATREATFSRARLGPSALPLGASVYRNLVAKGLTTPADELDRGWSTRQVADGRWMVTFRYVSRNRKQNATWEFDLRTKTVQAANRLANELAFVAGAPRPAAPSAAPTKPTKVPVASAPTDADRVVARRVAEARKAAEAQLAEATRKSTKHSVEVAKRAGAGKSKAKPRPKAAAAPAPEPAAPPEVVLAKEPAARPMLEVAEALAPSLVLPPADEPVPSPPRPSFGPEVLADPTVSAVAMVREAAEAMLSDFASGRIAEEPLAGPLPALTRSQVEAEPEVEAVAAEPPVAAPEPVEAQAPAAAAIVVPAPAAEPVVAEPPAPEPVVAREAAVPPAPRPVRPSRELTRVPTPAADLGTTAEASRRRRLRRGEAAPPPARTPTPKPAGADVEPVPVEAPPRGAPTFRDDLAAPARGNGSDRPAPDQPAPPPARPRRTTPLRAR